jgi:hypothetical protein
MDIISPFCIHPDVETMYTLADFGCCFVVRNADDFDTIIDLFCKDTPLCSDDFESRYIYFGQYLFTTVEQATIRAFADTISKNIQSSSWDLHTLFYVPGVTQSASQI